MKTTLPCLRELVRSSLFMLLLCYGSFLSAQSDPTDSTKIHQLEKAIEKIATIEDILASISSVELEIDANKILQSDSLLSNSEKEKFNAELEGLLLKLGNLKKDLMVITHGIDTSSFFEKPPDPEVDFNQEIRDMMYPIVDKIKRVTNRPREIERLKLHMSDNQERLEKVAAALQKLEELIPITENVLVKNHLIDNQIYWLEKESELLTKTDALRLHLEEMLSQEKDVTQIVNETFFAFFKSHGYHLLLAFLGMFSTLFILFIVNKIFHRIVKTRNWGDRKMWARLGDLFFYIFTFVASLTVFSLILISFSDWLMLGIFIALFILLLWALRSTLPVVFQQIKLLLNIGSVREGERVIYNNMPWQVESINLYSYLTNNELDKKSIRLPLKDLVDLRSRPYLSDEPWFPSSKGDWVSLDDGFTGNIIKQSADGILIEVNRGSLKSYSVENYLNANPQNLTRNNFSVSEIIGIHYKYRDSINDSLCPKLENYMKLALLKSPYSEWIEDVLVELEKMSDSSLDLEFFVKFNGGAAFDYFELPGRVQQLAMDALNHYGIEIPYPHLTIEAKEVKKKKI